MKQQTDRHLHMGCGEPLSGLAPLRALSVKPQKTHRKTVAQSTATGRRERGKQR